MIRTENLYDFSHSLAGTYLSGFAYPWQALEGIAELIRSLGPGLGEDYREVVPQVWVHKTAKVAPTAYLGAPCIIGGYGGATLRLHPGKCPGGRLLRGGQFRGAEKCDHF